MSNNTSTTGPEFERQQLLTSYFRVEFISAICLVILSPITVFPNSLLLTAIWRDPIRCFRTPTIYFIVGLAIADLVTGLVVEPFFALYFFAKYYHLKNPSLQNSITTLNNIAGGISTVVISTSFLLILGLSISQYIAVNYPIKFKTVVSKRNTIIYVTLSWVYFIMFSLLKLTGMSQTTFFKIDVALHPTFIAIVLLVVNVLIYRAFKKNIRKRGDISKNKGTRSFPNGKSTTTADIEEQSTFGRDKSEVKNLTDKKKECERKTKYQRKKRVERQFTLVVLHLATILLVSSFFHAIVFYIFLYKKPESFKEEVYVSIALRISDLMLFVKVAVDAFVYAWRLPTYRKAIIMTLLCTRSTPHI